MQRSMSMSKACGAFSTWSMPAPSGTDPGVMRIAFGGQTNSQSWHETHFSRPFGSLTSVGTPRYPAGIAGRCSGYSMVSAGPSRCLSVVNIAPHELREVGALPQGEGSSLDLDYGHG